MRSRNHALPTERIALPRRLVPRPATAHTEIQEAEEELNPRAQAIVEFLMNCTPSDYLAALVVVEILPKEPRSYCLDDLLADIAKVRPILGLAA